MLASKENGFHLATVGERAEGDNEDAGTPAAFSDWGSFRTFLGHLAYLVDASDPWAALGIPTKEGPPPSVESIEDRTRRALMLLSISDHLTDWSATDKELARQAARTLQHCRAACLA